MAQMGVDLTPQSLKAGNLLHQPTQLTLCRPQWLRNAIPHHCVPHRPSRPNLDEEKGGGFVGMVGNVDGWSIGLVGWLVRLDSC